MEASRIDRVHVDVAGTIVEITWNARDRLLKKLRFVFGCETIVGKFEAAGASRPVELDDGERLRLRVALEVWDGGGELPDEIARLLVALVRADSDARG